MESFSVYNIHFYSLLVILKQCTSQIKIFYLLKITFKQVNKSVECPATYKYNTKLI